MAIAPFGKLPLNTGTFLSRISSFMDDGVNYVVTGFKPGYALQAAELNEIHEQHLFYQTLSNRSSYNWKTYDLNSIPYWDGITPYNPTQITTSSSGNQITVTVPLRSWHYLIDSTINANVNSGIGFWINIMAPLTITISPPAGTQTVRYGFNYSIATINSTQNPILKDQSNSLIAGISVPGADRIQIENISLVQYSTSFTRFSELFAAKRTGNTYAIYWPYSNYSKKISGDITI